MESLYTKLYERYSKLKAAKDAELDKASKDQELKFLEFVSAAESLIENLKVENERLLKNVTEVQSERTAQEQQIDELQELLKEEKKKNQKLSVEVEQLRHMQPEKPCNSNMSDQNVNNIQHTPSASGLYNESPRRSTRKRTRLSTETDVTHSASAPGHVEPSPGRRSSPNHSRKAVSKTLTPLPVCCRSNAAGAGYSFSLKWLDKADQGEEALQYDVLSLGTFSKVAPEWMREEIIFNMNMFPMFFKKVAQVTKQC